MRRMARNARAACAAGGKGYGAPKPWVVVESSASRAASDYVAAQK